MKIFSLTPALGEEGWKIAAALTARHIGGAVNYMAVSETLHISPSTFGAGLAADDLILTLYFTTIYALAKAIPSEDAETGDQEAAAPSAASPTTSNSSTSSLQGSASSMSSRASSSGDAASSSVASSGSTSSAGGGHGGGSSSGRVVTVLEGSLAVALSATVCYVGSSLASALSIPSQSITIITALTVTLATWFPQHMETLAQSGEGLAQILMQVSCQQVSQICFFLASHCILH